MAKKKIIKECNAELCKYYDGTLDVDLTGGGYLRGWINHAHLVIPELADLEDETKLNVTITVEYDDGYVMHFDND